MIEPAESASVIAVARNATQLRIKALEKTIAQSALLLPLATLILTSVSLLGANDRAEHPATISNVAPLWGLFALFAWLGFASIPLLGEGIAKRLVRELAPETVLSFGAGPILRERHPHGFAARMDRFLAIRLTGVVSQSEMTKQLQLWRDEAPFLNLIFDRLAARRGSGYAVDLLLAGFTTALPLLGLVAFITAVATGYVQGGKGTDLRGELVSYLFAFLFTAGCLAACLRTLAIRLTLQSLLNASPSDVTPSNLKD